MRIKIEVEREQEPKGNKYSVQEREYSGEYKDEGQGRSEVEVKARLRQ